MAKRRLIAGTINRYPSEDGWENVHLDVSGRPLFDLETGRPGDRPAEIVCSLVDVVKHTGPDCFDEVRCSQVLEHLVKTDTPRALEAMYRVLHAGGKLDLDVPDLERIAQAWVARDYSREDLTQFIYGDPSRMPDDHFNAHRHGFWQESLFEALEAAGFREIKRVDDVHGTLVLHVEAIA